MAGKPDRRSYWDSCVFLAWVKAEPDRVNHIDVLMDEANTGRLEIVTSVLSITEVSLGASAKDPAALDAEVLKKIDALWQSPSPVKLTEFYRLIAEDARDMMRKAAELHRSLKPPDAIHLSTALRTRCDEFLSYDDLSAFAPLIGIPIRVPDSGTLPFGNASDDPVQVL